MKTSQKGFIAPLLFALIALLILGGGAYVYVQKNQANQPVQNTNAISATKHEAGSTYIYANENYRVLDSIQNPYVSGQTLIVAVKSLVNVNTCGGLYDNGPCEFFVESATENNQIQAQHIGTLDMKPVSFSPGSVHFTDAKTVELTASVGDAGAYAQRIWRINIEKWAPVQISNSQTAGWKTYNNREFGYNFKYPATYTIKEFGSGVQVYEFENTNGGQWIVNFEVEKSEATLNSIIKEEADGKALSEARAITIDGLSAYEGVVQGIVSWYGVFLKNNSDFVKITFNLTDKGSLQQDKAALTNTQKQILSTFKFNP